MKSIYIYVISLFITSFLVTSVEAVSQTGFIYLEKGQNSTDYRNLALNPLAANTASASSFPHATSNSEYNKSEFAARCAIDGNPANDSVHECGSWGPQRDPDIWWRLDFGRPVEIDKIVLYLRAAWFPPDNPHDSYWKYATLQFSDGSQMKLQLEQLETPQEFSFPTKVVTWLCLKDLKPVENKWCALCEFQAWGKDAPAFEHIPSAQFARQLRKDPLIDKAIHAMMGFQRASWEQGIAGQALSEAGELQAAISLVQSSFVHTSKQKVIAAHGGSPTDPLMLGNCLWWAAKSTNNPELIIAANNMVKYASKDAIRSDTGVPYHQPGSKEFWSDGSFTSPPMLALAGKYDQAITDLLGVYNTLWDTDKKLMHHRFSETKKVMTDPAFWGGGCGWTAAGFTQVIRALPPERISDRNNLSMILKDMIDSYLSYLRDDGLFYNIVDDPSSFVETNMSSMVAYSIYESVRGGWLDPSYLKHADKMRAAVRSKVDENGFVQGVAGAPSFDKPGISTEGQAFFILMEASAKKNGK